MISLWVSYLSIYSWRFPYDHLFWIGDGSHYSHIGGLVVEWGKILEELGMPFLDSFVGDDFLFRFLERGREDLSQSFFSFGVFGETKVASDNVSKESLVILFVLDEVIDHMIKDSANSIESFTSLADISETIFVDQDLLDNEGSNSSGEFLASLHNSQAEGDDFSLHQEVNSIAIVTLNKGTNDTKTGDSEVFEGLGLA